METSWKQKMAGAHKQKNQHKQRQQETSENLLACNLHYCPP